MTESLSEENEDIKPQTWSQKLMMGVLLHYFTVLGIVVCSFWGTLWLVLFSFFSATTAAVLSLIIPIIAGLLIALLLASHGIEFLLEVPPMDVSDSVKASIFANEE